MSSNLDLYFASSLLKSEFSTKMSTCNSLPSTPLHKTGDLKSCKFNGNLIISIPALPKELFFSLLNHLLSPHSFISLHFTLLSKRSSEDNFSIRQSIQYRHSPATQHSQQIMLLLFLRRWRVRERKIYSPRCENEVELLPSAFGSTVLLAPLRHI